MQTCFFYAGKEKGRIIFCGLNKTAYQMRGTTFCRAGIWTIMYAAKILWADSKLTNMWVGWRKGVQTAMHFFAIMYEFAFLCLLSLKALKGDCGSALLFMCP